MPIDSLTYTSQITHQMEPSELDLSEGLRPPSEGIYTYGLFIEGGFINREALILEEESGNDAKMFYPVPMILFKPKQTEESSIP